ncbi:proline dehydrogenase family protein [Aquimarina agarilytica]|uniref:proline dehydrogenase family protein n=1 Tax=Aquimarina agarilytica TaxID=1087449 RepID=UPI0002891821|nr:proline dehydrogenase family protein [Aquimarina agarilytica]
MLNFSDTQIAFSSKSTNELKKAYWLFKLIGWPWLTKASPLLLKIFMPFKFPIPIVRHSIFKYFCGGEHREDCNKSIHKLAQSNIKTILDYSVEHQTGNHQNNFDEAFLVIEKAKNNPNIPFVVFKMTGFISFDILSKKNNINNTLSKEKEISYSKAIAQINELCQNAVKANVPIFFDAEESWIQNAIDTIVVQLMRQYNKKTSIIYNTVQLYRKDQLAALKKVIALGKTEQFYVGLKLVRGAYVEKENERAIALGYESPIHISKKNCDIDFNLALAFCMDHIEQVYICCGSHNEYSNLLLTQLMEKQHIAPNDPRIYFAQLLGMSDHISFNLAASGYNVAKYMPYGPVKDVLPYLIRRAQENTSISGQTGRELSLITQELKRRKTNH